MPTPTHYSGIAVRVGALAHLVRASRIGARMRPTIARGISGRVGHGAPGNRRGKFHLRRNAIAREPPGASVTDQESAFGSPDDGSGAGDPGPDHEPSNYGSSASRPDSVAAELIAPNHSRHIDRLPGLRGAIFAPGGIDASGGAVRPSDRVLSTRNPLAIELRLDDSRRRHQVGVAGDRLRQPVDV